MEQDNNYDLNRRWQDKVNNFSQGLKKEIVKDNLIYYYCIISTITIYSASLYFKLPIEYSLTTYFDILYLACYSAGFVWFTYYYVYLIVKKEKHPTRQLITKIKSIIFPLNRTSSFILLLIVLCISFSNYTFLKSVIPIIHPYGIDNIIIEIDRFLHFGHDPWVLTHYIFSTPWASLLLNTAYNIWFFFMWSTLFFFLIYQKNQKLRKQFLLTFLLAWLVNGSIFATIFSSVGPCYFELLSNDNTFSPLMERLTEQSAYLESIGAFPLWALNTQNHLWQDYISQSNGIGSGISAMPSMHVSIAVLISLGIYQVRKTLGILAYAFTIIIQIGSVHLGWHYAIDGYFSITSTVILWKLVGHILVKNNKNSL